MRIQEKAKFFSNDIIAIIPAFFCTRLLVLFVFFVTQAFVNIADGEMGKYILLQNDVNFLDFFKILNKIAPKGDTEWYLEIASYGYSVVEFSAKEQKNWAFFPGFPMLWNFFSFGTKPSILSGILLANFVFFLALAGVRNIFLKLVSPKEAELSIWLLCVYPFSYFFSLPMTESLFLFCSSWFIVFFLEKRTWPTLIIGILAGLTRANAVFLALFPWSYYFFKNLSFAYDELTIGKKIKFIITFSARQFKLDFPTLIIYSSAPILGIICFMYHLYTVCGNPFAFKDIQVAWGRTSFVPFMAFFQAIGNFSKMSSWANFRLFNIITVLMMIASIYFLLRWCIYYFLEGESLRFLLSASLIIYLGLNLFIFTSSGAEMWSTMRFFACMFPAFCVGGKLLSLSPKWIIPITVVCAILLGAFSALFIIGFNTIVA